MYILAEMENKLFNKHNINQLKQNIMQKFLRTLMLAALMLPFASQAQTMYLTVADGTTTNSYVPVYGLYVDDFVRCQTVYPASMLSGMTGESVLGLTYYLSSPASASWGVANFVVNVMEVQDTTLSAFVDMTNATTVYTGSLDATQSTMEISFTVPYTYQGGNLLIEIYNTLEGTYKSASFYGVAATGASWQGNNGTSVANITGATRAFIPKTTFTYGQPPTCFKVTNLAIDNTLTTTNSLTLTWTDALNTGATYTVYDMADTSVVATGVTGTTYTVTGLNANTSYSYAVMTDCGGGDVTGLTAPVSGRTACAAMNLPWTCGFEANEIQSTTAATALPWCSYRYVSAATSGTTYPYSYSSSTYAHGGSRSLYFYGTTSTTYPDTMTFILPQVDVTSYPMDGNRLTFWARSSSTSYDKVVYVGTLTDPTDPTTYTFVDYVTVTGTTHTKYSIPLTTATATAPYVCVTVLKGSGSLYIDDMTLEEMPSCLEVTGLTASDITSSSVTLSWADASNPAGTTYSVYDMSDTTLLGTAATTTYTVTGLNSDFQYNFGVQANCSAGDAPYTTVSARTACAVVTMPWSENFDDWTSKSPCWSFLSGAYNGGNGTPTASTSAWTLNSTYGSYITISGKALTMNLYSTNKYWAVTPLIEITGDALFTVDLAASAWSAAAPNYDDNDTLAVAISTDGGTTFTTLQVLTQNDLNALTGTYTTIYIPVNGHTGDTVRFAIYGGSTSGTSPYDNRMVIDNFSVVANAGDICYPVTGLTVSNITENGATLTWVGTANSYNVYTISGTDTTLYQNVTDTAIILTGLTAMTNYTYGVTAVCSSDESTMATVSFSTACTALTLPYTETFEATSNTIGCWTTDGPGSWSVGTGDYSTTTGAFEGSLNAMITHGTSGDATKLISPVIDMGSAAGMQLVFAHVQRAWGGDVDELRVYTRASATAAWDTVATYTAAVENWTVETLNLTGTIYQVAFEMTDNWGYGVGIDSVVFNLPPSCMPVSDLTVDAATETSVTISWTGTAASYDVYNGTTLAANVTTNTYTFTGLTAATSYTFGVQAICSATDSAALVTVNATTACSAAAINLPFTETFNATSGTRNCWTTIDGDNDGFGWSTIYNGSDAEVMISASYDNDAYNALTPDNWLISPKLHTTAGGTLTLEWTVGAADNSYYAEHYGVYVSTTTTDTNSFTLVNEWTLTSATAQNMNLDLSAYAGQDIYVAFRHFNCTDMYLLLIDDVEVYEGVYTPDTLTVTFITDNATMGTTIPAPGTYQYITGDSVFFGSQANAGYRFLMWEMTADGETDTLDANFANGYYFPASAFLANGNNTVIMKAYFEVGNPDSTTITYAVNDATMGTITPAPGTYTIYVGNAITATATPNAGYVLNAWVFDAVMGGNVVNSDTILNSNPDFDNPMNFGILPQIYADYGVSIVITAIFEADTTGPVVNYYTVTVNYDSTMGTVTGIPTAAVAEGTVVTLTATAKEGYKFVSWSTGDTVATISITVNSNVTLSVTFQAVQGIDDVDANGFTAYSVDNRIVVKGAENMHVYVYDVNGRCIRQQAKAAETEEFTVQSTGVYLVKVGNAPAKRVVVVR